MKTIGKVFWRVGFCLNISDNSAWVSVPTLNIALLTACLWGTEWYAGPPLWFFERLWYICLFFVLYAFWFGKISYNLKWTSFSYKKKIQPRETKRDCLFCKLFFFYHSAHWERITNIPHSSSSTEQSRGSVWGATGVTTETNNRG